MVEMISHLAGGGNRNFDKESKKAAQINIICQHHHKLGLPRTLAVLESKEMSKRATWTEVTGSGSRSRVDKIKHLMVSENKDIFVQVQVCI